MKFLMIVSGYPPVKSAGMENGCQRLAEALCRRGHPTTVLTMAEGDLPEERTEEYGVRVLRTIRPLALGPLWGLTYMRQIKRAMMRLREEWDFALSHKLYLHTVAMNAACAKLRKPGAALLVNAGEFSDLKILREHRGGAAWVAKALQADAFFHLSRQSRAELLAEGVSVKKLYDYRYFIDENRFAPDGEAPDGPFLFLGRLHEQKNLPLLIRAFTRVWKKHPAARLRIVGKGPEEEAVNRAVTESGAPVKLESWTDRPELAYREARAVVTASNAEGLSNVLIEAMASGAPVLTTDVSGAREALDPYRQAPDPIPSGQLISGFGGFLTALGDEKALAEGMERLMDDDEAQRLGAKARERALEAFTEEAVLPEFIANCQAIARQ